MTDLVVGQRRNFTGFFTKALFVRGRSQGELERSLGYGSARLAAGYWLLFAEQMPTPENFEFGGYTHFSNGIPEGHLFPGNQSVERMLGAGGNLRQHKLRIIRDVFRISGPERLAKVIPVNAGRDYPAGAGIPQWKLLPPGILFRVVAKVDPGQRYLGDYR